MKSLAFTLGVALLVWVAFQLQPSAGAQSGPSRIIDRKLVCTTAVHAGIRKISVFGQAAVQGQKDLLGGPARSLTRILTGGSLVDNQLGGISGGTSTPLLRARLWIGTERCRSKSVEVPLSARGLDGGRASPFGDAFECFPPRTVFVRVRGIFRSPTRLKQTSRNMLSTSEALREGYVAVRAESGKPLVYAEVFESGKARLFTSPSCIPD